MLNVNDSGELSINGGTPYQQLVTDGNGNAKWEDRLAYEATEEQVIFSQEDIAFTEAHGQYGAGPIDMPETISVGEKFRVDFDGKTYDCIAYSIDPGVLDSPVLIGNGSKVGTFDDTGEPFLVSYEQEQQSIDILTELTSPTHTVSITKVVETVHKIPMAYLPEKTKVYVSSDSNYMYFDSERTKKLSAEDFISAVNSGGIDFIILLNSAVEAHPQMIEYGIIESSGVVIANIAKVSSDGSTIDILTRNAEPASVSS